MSKEFRIVDPKDKLFCMCMRTEDGVVQLIGKNTIRYSLSSKLHFMSKKIVIIHG